MTTEKQLEKGISDIAGVFTDPIIVYPAGGWENDIPEKVKQQVTLQRLVMCMSSFKGEEPTGTDAEALAYMIPRTLEAPLDRDWVDIYLYLGTKFAEFNKSEMPEDIRIDSLSDYQMGLLNHLKAWIYEKRRGVRQDKERAGRRQEKEEKTERKREAQPAMFDFDEV